MVMQVRPPPPMPAITRPAMMVGALGARPQMSVPTPKKMLLKMRPALRPKMSVSLPESGWHAELAMRYPVASQERSERELKSDDMGPVSVATMLVSRYH